MSFGKKEGFEIEYYLDGKLKRETSYKSGLKEGLEKNYDTKGNLESKIYFRRDNKVWEYYFYGKDEFFIEDIEKILWKKEGKYYKLAQEKLSGNNENFIKENKFLKITLSLFFIIIITFIISLSSISIFYLMFLEKISK